MDSERKKKIRSSVLGIAGAIGLFGLYVLRDYLLEDQPLPEDIVQVSMQAAEDKKAHYGVKVVGKTEDGHFTLFTVNEEARATVIENMINDDQMSTQWFKERLPELSPASLDMTLGDQGDTPKYSCAVLCYRVRDDAIIGYNAQAEAFQK